LKVIAPASVPLITVTNLCRCLANCAERAGIDFNKIGGSFTGTVGEIEEYVQGIRSTREYAFNAGLTSLQGDIDKELQNIKKDSAREVARIQSENQIDCWWFSCIDGVLNSKCYNYFSPLNIDMSNENTEGTNVEKHRELF